MLIIFHFRPPFCQLRCTTNFHLTGRCRTFLLAHVIINMRLFKGSAHSLPHIKTGQFSHRGRSQNISDLLRKPFPFQKYHIQYSFHHHHHHLPTIFFYFHTLCMLPSLHMSPPRTSHISGERLKLNFSMQRNIYRVPLLFH